MVTYTLREDLRNLIVCLYTPNSATDEQLTKETLSNYASDCSWQISNGEAITRFPYHITNIIADAERAEEEMRRRLAELRKDAISLEKQSVKPKAEERYSWGWSGGKRDSVNH